LKSHISSEQLRRRQAPQVCRGFLLNVMVKQQISEGVKTFIREQIQTVPKLEVLLLLHREQSRPFTLAEVANELGFENETAQEQLASLEAIGLIETNKDKSKYRYHPANPTLGSIVDRLAIAYPKQRVPILSAILAEDPNKVRRFVEAFKLTRSND
jgi:transcriptional regulator TrmB